MAFYKEKKGVSFEGLVGGASTTLSDKVLSNGSFAIDLRDYPNTKWKILVEEGDVVNEGALLFKSVTHPNLSLVSHSKAKVIEVSRNHLNKIVGVKLEQTDSQSSEPQLFETGFKDLSNREVRNILQETGYWATLRERPYGTIPDTEETIPEAIFINCMHGAPFQADFGEIIRIEPEIFNVGIEVLSKTFNSKLYLCYDEKFPVDVCLNEPIEKLCFRGKYPVGSSSYHISKIFDEPSEHRVWVINADDLLLIGELFVNSSLPKFKTISISGVGVREQLRQHYKALIGGSVNFLRDFVVPPLDNFRIISGSILSGQEIFLESYLPISVSSITVLPKPEKDFPFAWALPHFSGTIFSRFLSKILPSFPEALKVMPVDTGLHGETRPLILSGIYSDVFPFDCMVELLLEAILADDISEAVELGLLNYVPEDFAVLEYICPSKLPWQELVDGALQKAFKEGY